MFGVNQSGIWTAFGLSVVFHVAGFALAKILPPEPLLSSLPLVKPSIRLIELPRMLVDTNSKTTNLRLETDDKPARVSSSPFTVPEQNNEGEQTSAKPEEQQAESNFFKSIRYFESGEVDNTSELLEEWVIRTQDARSTVIVAIQLSLYINEDGRLDKFVVLNSSLSEIETDLLLKDLALTLFKPARKDDKPVPSQKNVEILLDPNPAVFRMPGFLNNFLPANK